MQEQNYIKLNTKIDDNFVTLNTKIDDVELRLIDRMDQQTVTILDALNNAVINIKKDLKTDIEDSLHKNMMRKFETEREDNRIYHEMYLENKEAIKSLDSRVLRLEELA